ncbi:MAG: T9SS type A sorting domain-containing protein [Flavobacteriales bacterium]|nr:T9SS type A sorting domain-containing protein [Flavobacteriales bacterium]
MALNNGQKLRPLVGAEQVVQQDLVPFMRNEGFSSVRQANVPAMATGDQGGIHPLWSFAPTRKGCFANASEWKKQNGTKVLAVPYRFAFSSDGVLNLGYFISCSVTGTANYTPAKADLLQGLVGIRCNPKDFSAYSANKQQRIRQRWAEHNTRMRNHQANSRANADATNKAIIGACRSLNAANDRSLDQILNYIRGDQNAVDPHTGQLIMIEIGASQYWMDQNGEYYGTDFWDIATGTDVVGSFGDFYFTAFEQTGGSFAFNPGDPCSVRFAPNSTDAFIVKYGSVENISPPYNPLGCDGTVQIVEENSLAADMMRAPNPVDRIFTITRNVPFDARTRVVVHDALGREVIAPFSVTQNSIEVDAAALTPGAYTITLYTSAETVPRRFVKH